MQTAIEKLRPDRLRTSGKMTAVLGFLCDQVWTDPAITEIVVVDGLALAGNTDDPLLDSILGDASSLYGNINGAAEAAKLTTREATWLGRQAQRKIRRS